MILIGSRALVLRAPQLLRRKPVDFDFIATQTEVDSWLVKNKEKIQPEKIYTSEDSKKIIVEGKINCEFELIQPNTSTELLLALVNQDPKTIHTDNFGSIPNLDLLFTIKSSHRFLRNSPYFWKTLFDYHLMKSTGAIIRPEYQTFLKLREQETYTYLHPKLNQSKDAFFVDDQIVYSFDHDTVHQSVAIFEKPAYTYYLKDGAEVDCDKHKFFALPQKYQLAGVVEEAAVLAIERSLVPHPGIKTPKEAWYFALSKVCSSITSGWFREFAYQNALEILPLYPEGYWEKFQNDVKSGLVKPFQK